MFKKKQSRLKNSLNFYPYLCLNSKHTRAYTPIPNACNNFWLSCAKRQD